MTKTRIDVYKRVGDFWSYRYTTSAGPVAPSSVWATRDEVMEVVRAVAEERWREHGESVEIYYEDMGAWRLYPHGRGAL